MFNWARSNGFVYFNYFEGKQLKSKKRKASEARDRFSNDEIKILFQDYGNFNLSWQKWIPLIIIYTGARVNEIASLYRNDIYQVDNIWVFDINDNREDKHLKNIALRRIIPVYYNLIVLGLIDYINNYSKNQHIWPELKYSKNGYGLPVSRWFND